MGRVKPRLPSRCALLRATGAQGMAASRSDRGTAQVEAGRQPTIRRVGEDQRAVTIGRVGPTPESREVRMQRWSLTALLVIAVVFLGLAPAAGQSADTSTPPRTPWGAPDLQGVWDFRTITPLERPEEFAGRELLTDDEAAAREGQALERAVDRPPEPGRTGAYNRFWSGRSQLRREPADLVDRGSARWEDSAAGAGGRAPDRLARRGPAEFPSHSLPSGRQWH